MGEENPNNEMQDIVDFMERDYGDEDFGDDTLDGRIDYSRDEDE